MADESLSDHSSEAEETDSQDDYGGKRKRTRKWVAGAARVGAQLTRCVRCHVGRARSSDINSWFGRVRVGHAGMLPSQEAHAGVLSRQGLTRWRLGLPCNFADSPEQRHGTKRPSLAKIIPARPDLPALHNVKDGPKVRMGFHYVRFGCPLGVCLVASVA